MPRVTNQIPSVSCTRDRIGLIENLAEVEGAAAIEDEIKDSSRQDRLSKEKSHVNFSLRSHPKPIPRQQCGSNLQNMSSCSGDFSCSCYRGLLRAQGDKLIYNPWHFLKHKNGVTWRVNRWRWEKLTADIYCNVSWLGCAFLFSNCNRPSIFLLLYDSTGHPICCEPMLRFRVSRTC